MLTLDDILDFFDVPTGDAFDVPPERAIDFFAGKGLKPTFSYADMLGEAHASSFTIAKMMDVDMLGQIRASLDSALANGTPFKEWASTITPVLQSGGWWGKQQVLDPLTGKQVVAQLGAPWRLETIFRTNMQSSYAAGAWGEIEKQAEIAPFLMYDAVDDLRTRPLHAAWDRKVLPVASLWWHTHYPPNGYNCRCGVIQLDSVQVESLGLTVSTEPPFDGTYTWTNPRTGVKEQVPNGLDPGFDTNPGLPYGKKVDALLAEKVSALGAAEKAAAEEALMKAKAAQAEIDAATAAAQKELAKKAGEAALARAQLLAQQKAAEWAAQQQIDLIAKGKETAGKGAAYKIKALEKLKQTDAWPEYSPSKKLEKVLELANDYKVANETASKVALYKKAVLSGKVPPPAAVKAFNSLTEAGQADVLKKIAAEQAKIAAEKAAAEAAQAAAAAAAQANPAILPAAKPAFIDTPGPNPATMSKIGAKTKGGTPGALYQDTDTGTKWLVKFNGSEDAVRNEVLSSKLYNLAGVEAPDLHAIVIDGKPAVASRIIDGIQEVDAQTLARTASVQEGFAVDAWLANWDAAGLDYDNTVLIGGRALRIDVGGALRYRAVGGLKGKAFGDLVGELESLRDSSLNTQSAKVFGKITPAQLEAGAVKVLRVRDEDIRALVDRYGPTDPAEARALAAQLIARKADIARRFPRAAEIARQADGIADAAPPKPPRVTATEQAFVEESRVNGYGFPTDSDQIEDNMVLAHAFKKADGADATRGWFKLLRGASDDLAARIGNSVGSAPSVVLAEARQKVLDAIKSINFRASKGEALDAKVVARIAEMKAALDRMQKSVDQAVDQAADPTALLEKRDLLLAWGRRVEALLEDAKAGRLATKVPGMFPVGDIPDALDYTKKAAPALPAGLKWKKQTGPLRFQSSKLERSFATETGGESYVHSIKVHYTAELPDGTVVTFVPHDAKNAWTLQGVVKIDAPGKGVQSTSRIFEAMEAAGLKSVRATEIDRKHLYLNAFARLRLIRADSLYRDAFAQISERTEEGLRKKLDLLKQATGVDIEASEGWRNVGGVRQAFGHGRAYQLRPDLTPEEMAELDRTHVVYTNPQGLGTDARKGMFERLKGVIEGGGVLSSLSDRIRRGVELAGSSVSTDLASGGGDYLFTRVIKRDSGPGSGIYWRTETLRRMDAITYDSDQYGRTTEGHMEKNRLGQTISSFREVSQSSSNETMFKAGISLFDNLERIVLENSTEVNAAVSWMQDRGYTQWPDGRKLSEVIISKADNAKRR